MKTLRTSLHFVNSRDAVATDQVVSTDKSLLTVMGRAENQNLLFVSEPRANSKRTGSSYGEKAMSPIFPIVC